MPSSAPPPPPPPKQSPSSSSSSAAPKPPPTALRDRKKLQSGGGGGCGGGRKEQRAVDSSRELSRESSSSSLVSPYHVTEVASPERVWMESLRQGGVPVPVPPTSHPMRPTHSYTPLQRGAAENSELKFAFDMELQKRTGGAAPAAPGEMDEVKRKSQLELSSICIVGNPITVQTPTF